MDAGNFSNHLADEQNKQLLCFVQAVGEPPFGLATTVFFAIKDAIAAARNDAGLGELFSLDSPATAERIRMACADDFTKQVTFAVVWSCIQPRLTYSNII